MRACVCVCPSVKAANHFGVETLGPPELALLDVCPTVLRANAERPSRMHVF